MIENKFKIGQKVYIKNSNEVAEIVSINAPWQISHQEKLRYVLKEKIGNYFEDDLVEQTFR